MADKTARRSNRDEAVKLLNKLAAQISKPAIPRRAGGEDVRKLYEELCSELEDREELSRARSLWVENGGVELDESLLLVRVDAGSEDEQEGFPGGEQPVSGHRRLHTVAAAGKSFRMRARAFMLTFNSR